ncbi:hypothetical protein CR513_17088, partial [Mucuna pruriens]
MNGDEGKEQSVDPHRQNRMKMEKKKMRSKMMSNVDSYAGFMNPSYALSSSFLYQQQPPLLPLPTASPVSLKNNRKNKSKREQVKKKPTQTQTTREFVTTITTITPPLAGNGFATQMMDSASWVFNLSPPPSSLPLPKFCVRRSNLTCNAQTN